LMSATTRHAERLGWLLKSYIQLNSISTTLHSCRLSPSTILHPSLHNEIWVGLGSGSSGMYCTVLYCTVLMLGHTVRCCFPAPLYQQLSTSQLGTCFSVECLTASRDCAIHTCSLYYTVRPNQLGCRRKDICYLMRGKLAITPTVGLSAKVSRLGHPLSKPRTGESQYRYRTLKEFEPSSLQTRKYPR
jgi:hypothetical protein